MKITKPVKLIVGDTVGIVSPASGVATFCPQRMKRGISCLQDMGFNVVLGEHCTESTGHTAGTIEHRVSDLHAMYSNNNVKAIITTIGGYNSHQLLDELDYELIGSNPKILLGYSDITALQLGIFSRTGIVTYMGPAILHQFGEFSGLFEYTRDSFEQVLMKSESSNQIMAAEAWTDESLLWDIEDDHRRTLKTSDGWKVLKHGEAVGRIVSGNMSTLLLLAGTEYLPDMTGAILCLEDDETTNPAIIDRYLTQLRHMGVYDQISALIVGRFPTKTGFSEEDSLENLLRIATRGYSLPIVYDFDFGHTDPMMILPNGVEAALNVTREHIQFQLLESAVSEI